jgi:hypothetical protein
MLSSRDADAGGYLVGAVDGRWSVWVLRPSAKREPAESGRTKKEAGDGDE